MKSLQLPGSSLWVTWWSHPLDDLLQQKYAVAHPAPNTHKVRMRVQSVYRYGKPCSSYTKVRLFPEGKILGLRRVVRRGSNSQICVVGGSPELQDWQEQARPQTPSELCIHSSDILKITTTETITSSMQQDELFINKNQILPFNAKRSS